MLDLDSRYAAAGAPRSLTGRLGMYQSGLAWTSDGTSVIFNAVDINLQVKYLWRAAADGTRPPERIELAGVNALFPSIAPAGDRLAFARLLHDEDIYRLEPGRPPGLSPSRRRSRGSRHTRATAAASRSARRDRATQWKSGSRMPTDRTPHS